MNSTINLAVDVPEPHGAVYRSAAARLPGLEVVGDVQESQAVVTADPHAGLDIVIRGGHMLVLEPFAVTNGLRDVLASSGRTMPALTSRFQPSTQQVKQALDDGKLGVPGLLRIHCWKEESDCREDDLASVLDVAMWMFGCPPTEVYTVARQAYRQVHLGFPSAGMALVDVDSSLPPGNDYHSLSLIGAAGASYDDDHHNVNLLLAAPGTLAIPVSQQEATITGLMKEFVTAIAQDRPFSPNWGDVQLALQLEEIARLSASQKRVLVVESN